MGLGGWDAEWNKHEFTRGIWTKIGILDQFYTENSIGAKILRFEQEKSSKNKVLGGDLIYWETQNVACFFNFFASKNC